MISSANAHQTEKTRQPIQRPSPQRPNPLPFPIPPSNPPSNPAGESVQLSPEAAAELNR
ncbi:MAG: hypothetical protein J0I12_28740 [Candidatus Eremiobacteraeota bacterium]|nr:hypothetical protein [Candidatus Eremiobacteraeota bacterium]